MKRAFVVCGGESTGTRLVTAILLAAGCTGTSEHVQPYDTNPPTGELIAWRRSLPHSGHWPDLRKLITDLQARGYAVTLCVTMRDWFVASASQVAVGHVQSEEAALANLRRAYVEATDAAAATLVPYLLVSYESLIAQPMKATRALLTMLGLPMPPPGSLPPIRDENIKRYATVAGGMLTDAERARLTELNTDHHRRMAALSIEHRKANKTELYRKQNDQSRAELIKAMIGCRTRYKMQQPNATVLELGASFGNERDFLLNQLSAQEYVGIEIVEAAANAGAPKGVLHMAIEDMPEAWEGRYAYVYSRHVMEHVIDLDIALATLKRVLAPNGIIGAVTPHFFPDTEPAHVTQLKKDQWVAAYARHGLKAVYAKVGNYMCAECHLVAVHAELPT